ncbi:MAG: HhH-GPD family protein [Methanothrix sp.]
MAELMLHRTQAKQVIPIYEKFIKLYPNINSLAHASKADLNELLHPLGLFWRVKLVYALGVDLIIRFNGQVPKQKEYLLLLPGISDYIAGAVRCFAWNLPEPIIDTNIIRIIGRIFGLKITDSSRRNSQMINLIKKLVDPVSPRTYNYALLDLASEVCLKRRPPLCSECPIREHCAYCTEAVLSSKN